jgi:hypothetical protein
LSTSLLFIVVGLPAYLDVLLISLQHQISIEQRGDEFVRRCCTPLVRHRVQGNLHEDIAASRGSLANRQDIVEDPRRVITGSQFPCFLTQSPHLPDTDAGLSQQTRSGKFAISPAHFRQGKSRCSTSGGIWERAADMRWVFLGRSLTNRRVASGVAARLFPTAAGAAGADGATAVTGAIGAVGAGSEGNLSQVS